MKETYPDLDSDKLARTRALMLGAVRDCLVTGYQPLVDTLDLPDPDDRHVVAAAIKSHAQVIVTSNIRDFPPVALEPWGVEAKDPDSFVLDQIDLAPNVVYGAILQIADSRRNPPQTVSDVLGQLERAGLVESVAALRR